MSEERVPPAPRVLLAPMAGVTEAAFRRVCGDMGADATFTEMVSAVGLLHAKPDAPAYARLLHVYAGEAPVVCQLFGRDPTALAQAAMRVTALGRFCGIDLNMGCPARKIVSAGEGSALMDEPALAGRIIEAVARSTPLPVSVKMRLGTDDAHPMAAELARVAEGSGAAFVTVHGRTRRAGYSGRADWARVAAVRESVRVPVIVNGDIASAADAVRALAETGCAGVMVGRGAIGNPFLFREIRAALRGQACPPPTGEERLNAALRHARDMAAYKGEALAVREMRALLGHYVAGMRGASALRGKLQAVGSIAEIETLLSPLFLP